MAPKQGTIPLRPFNKNDRGASQEEAAKNNNKLNQINCMFANQGLSRKRHLDQNNPLATKRPSQWTQKRSTSTMSSFGSTMTASFVANDSDIFEYEGKTLNNQQSKVLRMALEGKSLFYTGSAGTGKSFLLHAIIHHLRQKYPKGAVVVTASTGLAAVNIGGSTLHSFAKIGFGKLDANVMIKRLAANRKNNALWNNIRVLIIDEVSMINGQFFDTVNDLAIAMKGANKPFGGIQLILTGDFFQLPPVVTQKDMGTKAATFCFESISWRRAVTEKILLTEVFRQKDAEFVDMLNSMRLGIVTPQMRQKFLELQRPVKYQDDIEPTYLYSRRDMVKRENETRLSKLSTKPYVFQAKDARLSPQVTDVERYLREVMADKTLTLKIGTQVILIHSVVNKEHQYVLPNGLTGVVVSFMPDSLDNGTLSGTRQFLQEEEFAKMFNSRILKETADGDKYDAYFNGLPDDLKGKLNGIQKTLEDTNYATASNWFPLVRFTVPQSGGFPHVHLIKTEDFKIEDAAGRELVQRTQIPLLPSWALSIHKAQGQTLERVVVDFKSVFERGQAYVALSRCVSLDSLEIRNFSASAITANPKVKKFYEELTQTS